MLYYLIFKFKFLTYINSSAGYQVQANNCANFLANAGYQVQADGQLAGSLLRCDILMDTPLSFLLFFCFCFPIVPKKKKNSSAGNWNIS